MNLGALTRRMRHALAASLAFLCLFAASPGASAQCVSGISSADVFGFAEATFPFLFPQAPSSGRILNYDYRYYAGTGNYLGVQDSTCAIVVYGPLTGYTLFGVGTTASFSTPILNWRTQGGVCTYTVSPTSFSVGAAGGTMTVDVRQVQTACTVPNPPWAITSQTAWLTNARAGSLSNGQGPAYFYVEPNSGGSRSGTVLVAGVTVRVTQSAGSSGSSYAGNYAGHWSGSCTGYGTISGSFSMTVTSSGGVSGTYSGSDNGSFAGSIATNGSFSASGGVSGGATWSGTIVTGGNGSSGQWVDSGAGCSGSWSIP